MPSLVKDMGKVSASPFGNAKSSISSSASNVKSKLPVFAVLILAGVAIVFILRNRSGSTTQTGAALTIVPSGEADASTIANITAGINAIAGQVHTPAPEPSGGASTPITVSPRSTTYTADQPSSDESVQKQIAAEYAGSGYNPPSIAGGPIPSGNAYSTGPVSSPSEILTALQKAASLGYGQIILPSGEYIATNPNTQKQVAANIAASSG